MKIVAAANIFIDSLLLMQNSFIARVQDKLVDSIAVAARTRREQQLKDFIQREPSQFERVETNLQQRAKQELEQTHKKNRSRNKNRNRNKSRVKDKKKRRKRENKKSETSTKFISKQQQKILNNKDFYEVFQI